MSGCRGLDTVGGVPSGSASAVPSDVTLQGVLVRQVGPIQQVGSVSDTVLLFDGASTQVGSVPLANWITRTNSATLGTTLDILQSGIYACLLYIPLNGNADTQWAITYNATVAQQQGNTEPFDPEVYASNFKFVSTLQSAYPQQAIIPVLQSDIDAGTAVIRAHMNDTMGGPPLANDFSVIANVVIRIFRIAEVGA